MMVTARKLLPFALLSAAIVAGWLIYSIAGGRHAQLENAFVLPERMVLQDFALVDQDGSAFGPDQLKDRWTLLFFGFTHCPDICPATLQILSLAREKLLAAEIQAPRILLVSVDPDRDTPEILNQYVSHFGDGIDGVTGPVAELRKLTATLGVYFEKIDEAGSDYSMAHSAHIILLDPDVQYAAVFSAPHNVDALVHDLPLILRQ